MKKLLPILILLGIGTPVVAAPIYRVERSILPETTSTYFLGSTTPSTVSWKGIITDQLCLGGVCLTSPVGTSTNPFMASYFVGTSTIATSTFAGPLIFTGTGGNNQIKIDPNFAYPNSTSIGGAMLLENTGNTGAGLVAYTNVGATADGRLGVFRCDNSAFDQDCLNIAYDGTASGLSVLGTGGQGFSVSHSGSGHAAGINYTGTGETSTALNLTSSNQNFTTLGITGYETGHGTIKVSHIGGEPNDSSAAALSIDLTSTSTKTAAQGIFITSTTGGTTGNLMTLRNPQDIFTVRSTGNVGIWDSEPDASLEIVATTTQDILNISSTANADGDLLTMLYTGKLGIGTTTPYAKLSVVGPVVAEYFNATSTTVSNLPNLTTTLATTTNATTTSLAVLGLTAASCDVKATTGGVIYCGTDATGGGGGDFAWTPTTNFNQVANATSLKFGFRVRQFLYRLLPRPSWLTLPPPL